MWVGGPRKYKQQKATPCAEECECRVPLHEALDAWSQWRASKPCGGERTRPHAHEQSGPAWSQRQRPKQGAPRSPQRLVGRQSRRESQVETVQTAWPRSRQEGWTKQTLQETPTRRGREQHQAGEAETHQCDGVHAEQQQTRAQTAGARGAAPKRTTEENASGQ